MISPCSRWMAAALAASAWWLAGGSAQADEISRATIRLDVTQEPATAEASLTWAADESGSPRAQAKFWLAAGLEATAASVDGSPLPVAAGETKAGRQAWLVTMPSPVPAGGSKAIELTWTIAGDASGIRTGASGYLLPGSGWFPSSSPETDERMTHTLEFVTAEGRQVVAAGDPLGDTRWASPSDARPFAAWGEWKTETAPLGGIEATIYRPLDASGDLPLARMNELVEAVEGGVGPIASGARRLVHVGDGQFDGGFRTFFWDENSGLSDALRDRAFAGAVGASAWTEEFRFRGDQAAFLSRALAHYLGDVAVIATDPSDDRTDTERTIIGPRRAEFVRGHATKDRALLDLAPTGTESEWVLATRGALLAHLVAESAPSRSHYLGFLRHFRDRFASSDVDGGLFSTELGVTYPNQHGHLDPFFRTTDLPAMRIDEHGQATGKGISAKGRYRIQVENTGTADGVTEVAAFSRGGHLIRTFNLKVEAGKKRSVAFRDATRIARIELDPRGATLQVGVEEQGAERVGDTAMPTGEYIPSFAFNRKGGNDFWEVTHFSLELPGVPLENFTGHLQYWETHHGPSGILLLGDGTYVVTPDTDEHRASFVDQMGRESAKVYAKGIYVRFPLSAWSQIEGQLGAQVPSTQENKLGWMRDHIYQHSHPAGFTDDSRAQVPPPGSAMVVSKNGDEWRGWIRMPQSDGKVKMRYWDHLRSQTIWEAVH